MKKEKKEVAYEVYTTKDYSMFKRLVGNRNIPENRLNKIINSIEDIGWIRNPIVVNEKMEVVDGQGRLTALERLNLPVEYIIAPGASTRECIYMNMNMVNWKLQDFVKSYAEQGKEDYKRLLNLMEKYVGGNLNMISTALYRVSKAKLRDIKDGTLRLSEQQYLDAIPRLEFVQPLWEKLNPVRLPGSMVTLIQTLIYYYDYPEVDKKRLAHSIEKYIYTASPWVLNVDCEREVENIYNYNMKFENKISIAHLVKRERTRHQLELNKMRRESALERTQKGVAGFIK